MYREFSFMANIDGSVKFMQFFAVDMDGAKADLIEAYGASFVEISLWREVRS